MEPGGCYSLEREKQSNCVQIHIQNVSALRKRTGQEWIRTIEPKKENGRSDLLLKLTSA